ncbi:MAG: cytochrome P450 [Demequina sp.]
MTEQSSCPHSASVKPEIQGYRAVRRAAKDYRSYSSDLQGDADVRSYRQLPLEVDPPRHTQLRASLMPLFAAEAIEVRMPEFSALAKRLAAKVTDAGSADLVADFALPYVMGCLGIIYNRPQDVEEWISWGPDVWLADAHMRGEEITEETKQAQRERDYSRKTQRSAAVLDGYLERVFAEAQNSTGEPREPNNVWEFLVDARPGGEPMTQDEMLGTGNVLLAGGRDTVIKLISGFLWHLISHPEDREYLRDNPHHRPTAITEMARYLSPLPKLERKDIEASHEADAERRVLLSFVSGNFDDTQFPDPESLDFHREDKPTLAFGFGRHSCLGLQITFHEAMAFLDALLPHWPAWEFDGEPAVVWSDEGVGDRTVRIVDHIESLHVRSVK